MANPVPLLPTHAVQPSKPPVKVKTPDMMLREEGFVIVARPADGEPLWKRRGKVMTETQSWIVLNRLKTGVMVS